MLEQVFDKSGHFNFGVSDGLVGNLLQDKEAGVSAGHQQSKDDQHPPGTGLWSHPRSPREVGTGMTHLLQKPGTLSPRPWSSHRPWPCCGRGPPAPTPVDAQPDGARRVRPGVTGGRGAGRGLTWAEGL